MKNTEKERIWSFKFKIEVGETEKMRDFSYKIVIPHQKE